MTEALFYPWIDIYDEAWLKTSLLYWDSIRTIVPESIVSPYSTQVGRTLQDAGFLVPLRVTSDMPEIEDLTADALTYLASNEGAELLISGNSHRRRDIHVEKLPRHLVRLAEMHPEKLPREIQRMLATSPSRGSDWLAVDEGFADFYMTLLANRLADRIGASPLTSLPSADGLAVVARLDGQLSGMIPWGPHRPWGPWREYEAFGVRRHMPRHLAPGLLAQLAIQRIAVAPDTPIGRLVDFKKTNQDELAAFRQKIDQLSSVVEADLSAEALYQRVKDLYANEVAPAVRNLKRALRGRRIRWLGESLLKVAFLSVGPTVLATAGLPVSTALLAGVGISLVVSRTMYNVDRREALQTNPYTYLLSIEELRE